MKEFVLNEEKKISYFEFQVDNAKRTEENQTVSLLLLWVSWSI